MKRILVTGGAGFIGSHLIKKLLTSFSDYKIFNIDNLTYAGKKNNLLNLSNKKNYKFIQEDICDYKKVCDVFKTFDITDVIHLAAESHVDRSIENSQIFGKTNVLGTISLLEAAKNYWKFPYKNNLFYHISTDEVYGSLGKSGKFSEITSYNPHSPYSASKASSDHFVRSFYDTYSLPVIISNCSNNYGPNQDFEKLIPTVIKCIINQEKIPIYGDGSNIRDWLYVEDHIDAIITIFNKGKNGETYCIGGNNEISNLDLVYSIIEIADKLLDNKSGHSKKLISFVSDRLGHDYRYAIDISKIKNNLNWTPNTNFELGLFRTIEWYINESRNNI